MEFDLDYVLVDSIFRSEYALARADIDALGVEEAYRRSCKRHDEHLANARDAHTLACRAGCSWCCYFSVDVRAVEAVAIAQFMERELSPQLQARICDEIAANAALMRTLSDEERVQRNIKCPFLHGGRCAIYAARPQTCRNYHATNAAGCQQSYEQPSNLEIDPDFAPQVYQSGGAHVDAFAKALHDAGIDDTVYELSLALSSVFADPGTARARLSQRLQPFPHLLGTHVDLQFDLGKR